jgi:hypothetical protein
MGWGKLGFKSWVRAIERRARGVVVVGANSTTKAPWLGFRERTVGGAHNWVVGTYMSWGKPRLRG